MLHSLARTAEIIQAGAPVLIAGQEHLLRTLPRGNWIAGTIPYFMDVVGGVISESLVFVTPLPRDVTLRAIRSYGPNELEAIVTDAPDNGLTLLIIPAFSEVHSRYAQRAPEIDGLFMKPIAGWVAGVHLRDLGTARPYVMNGLTGERSSQDALAMHLAIPDGKIAHIKTVNLFKQGAGETITFEHDGFKVGDCMIDGRAGNFAEHLVERRIDTRLPLVANYAGALVNVSIQAVDKATREVTLYAPVFAGVEYKIAAPIDHYVKRFERALPHGAAQPVFACNCILNFLYSELEGKSTGAITGPITFGEIAYQLLNQTVVYVEIA